MQAFSHFSYNYSNKKLMVCDLQGTLDEGAVPQRFELTDPAIHYASQTRRNVYGRTDKGALGFRMFFDTHKCNGICRRLGLGKGMSGPKGKFKNRKGRGRKKTTWTALKFG